MGSTDIYKLFKYQQTDLNNLTMKYDYWKINIFQ